MLKRAFPISTLLIFLCLAGCSFTHMVNMQPEFVAEEEVMPALNASGPVAVVVRTQKPSGAIEFCKTGGRTYLTDYDEIAAYTQSSIVDLLSRNGIQVDDAAEKKLTVTSLEGSCERSGALVDYTMRTTVETGAGLKKAFTGQQKYFHLYERDFALSAASLNAVLQMFNDEEIQQYLRQ